MLEKAKATSKNDDDDDDDDDGWSDDESKSPTVPEKIVMIPRRASVNAPPAVTLPPPVKKNQSGIISETKEAMKQEIKEEEIINEEKKVEASPAITPPPQLTPVIQEQKTIKPLQQAAPPKPIEQKTPQQQATTLQDTNKIEQKVTKDDERLMNEANNVIEKLVVKQQQQQQQQQPKEEQYIIDDKSYDIDIDNDCKNGTTSQSVRDARKIRDLEATIFDLKRKLEKAESRLTQQSFILGSKAREAELEKELDTAYERVNSLKSENGSLQDSVKALHIRLTLAETKNNEVLTIPIIPKVLENDVKSMERMKEMEKQLLKMKEEKDKVIRLIILLIGKDRMSQFLKTHSTEDDILSALVETFSNSGSIDNTKSYSNNNKNSNVGSPRKKK